MVATRHLALTTFALALPALVPAMAAADVYKCAGERGTPVYQEMPCEPGKELRNFQTDPPLITVLPPQGRPAPAPPAPKSATAGEPRPATDAKPGKSVASAGDASERKHIRVGMTESEVLTKLGHPDMTTGGKGGAAARWTYMPAPGDPETITALTLRKGAVTEIDRKVVKK